VFWRKSGKESIARSQTPITVSYPLEEVKNRLERKLDKLSDDISRKIDGLDKKIDKMTERGNVNA
jgi:Skp family chaperone for outer membrane proteins